MDISGEQQLDVEHNLYKKRLNADGKPINAEEEKHDGTLRLFCITLSDLSRAW